MSIEQICKAIREHCNCWCEPRPPYCALMNKIKGPNCPLEEDTLVIMKGEYPQVSQQWVPVKGRRVDWKRLALLMEQKIIEFENFGKKWFKDEQKPSST